MSIMFKSRSQGWRWKDIDTPPAMAEQGIVGRGVLLDFHSWRLAQTPPIQYEPFQTGSIPLKYLKAVAEAQGTEIKFGDILIIRSGGRLHFRL
jgi:Putative cyclase